MSIFFPTRAKVKELPPLHRDLVLQRQLGVMQPVAEWERLLASLSRHDEVTGGQAKYAIPQRFLDVAVPVLRVLLADADPAYPVGLSYLEGLGRPGPKTDVPDSRGRWGTKESVTLDIPLQAEARLRDRSHILVQELRRTRTLTYRKRGSSGKTKFKSKTKTGYRPQVILTLPKGVEPVRPSTPTPGAVRVQVKPGKRARVLVEFKAPQPAGVEAVLDLMTEAFRWSPKSRMTSRSTGGAA